MADFLSKLAESSLSHPSDLSQPFVVKSLQESLIVPDRLREVPLDEKLALVSLLRLLNDKLDHSLPYMSPVTFEDFWNVSAGSSCVINQSKKLSREADAGSSLSSCIRSGRFAIFWQTKRRYWDAILDVTATATALHQDEFEDPRDIKTLKINRITSRPSRLATLRSQNDRIRQSVLGQLQREVRSWPSTALRRSYLGRGHGGQKRAFKVKFSGEGVDDYGGPYRAVFEAIVDEVQNDSFAAGGTRAFEKCLLPIFSPCADRVTSSGLNQDKFLLRSNIETGDVIELVQFLGKLCGISCRHDLSLGFDLSSMVWKPLARIALSSKDVENVDEAWGRKMKFVEQLATSAESSGCAGLDETVPGLEDLSFTATLGDGSNCILRPDLDENAPITLRNVASYLDQYDRLRTFESGSLLRSLLDGMSHVIPGELFSFFSDVELERLICGDQEVSVDTLMHIAEYEGEGVSATSPHIVWFWEVLRDMTSYDRTDFLRFVWARSRMPTSQSGLNMNFRIQAASKKAESSPDDFLPTAQTCFFTLSLPFYTNKESLRSKLLYAIKNAPTMDADVVLHSAEGWADA